MDVKIIEKKTIPSGAIMLQGLPDVGLVGLIATSHVISKLGLSEMAFLDSEILPPVAVLHEGLPCSPVRVFGNKELVALISEVVIPAEVLQPIMQGIVEWAQSKEMKMVLSLGGIPMPNRQDITEPKVFGLASNRVLLGMLRDKGVEIMEEGFIVGPHALLMRYCIKSNVPAISLLSQAFYNYPDPEAAAATIKELSKIVDVQVDVSELLEKGEEIRLRLRDIMRRTQSELARMRKSQEYDLPSLYVA
ncbi:MAG: proteasome assembly chaperone family protein [Candidatus Bathycorpusculaceae bacterium]